MIPIFVKVLLKKDGATFEIDKKYIIEIYDLKALSKLHVKTYEKFSIRKKY